MISLTKRVEKFDFVLCLVAFAAILNPQLGCGASVENGSRPQCAMNAVSVWVRILVSGTGRLSVSAVKCLFSTSIRFTN
jgi:hypothetical protein